MGAAAVTTVCVEVGSLTLLGSGYVEPAVCSSKEKLVDGTVRRKTSSSRESQRQAGERCFVSFLLERCGRVPTNK